MVVSHLKPAEDEDMIKSQREGAESWRQFDFDGLRRELNDQIDAIIRQVDTTQDEKRTDNRQRVDDIALVSKQGDQITKELTSNLVAST